MSLLGVVFDFDGVIANSEPLHLRAYQDVLRSLGLELRESDYYERYLGYDDVGVFRAVAEDQRRVWNEGEIDRLLRAKADRLAELMGSGAVLFPGAAACVRRLAAAVPLAIASGALRHEIEEMLAGAGLRGHFRVIVGAEDAPRSKPAPDPYLRAVELLSAGVRPAEGDRQTTTRERASVRVGPPASARPAIRRATARLAEAPKPRRRHPDAPLLLDSQTRSSQQPQALNHEPRTANYEPGAQGYYVAIEDSRWGLESARGAGLKTVAITHTYPPDQLPGADLIVSSLDEVTLEILQKLTD